MCGIAGFFGFGELNKDKLSEVAQKMGDSLYHRGPDDGEFWIDEIGEIGLVHRRLSIIDLSETGKQPMISRSGRYVIVFNGEIYNHLELRRELEYSFSSKNDFFNWRGTSDTETILVAIEHWGLKLTLQKMIGMFAIALWDRQKFILHLCRDRFGEKPLYYGFQNGVFKFGSELKSLKVHPYFNNEISNESLALFMRHNYVPGPLSIYKYYFKLKPGSYLSISQKDIRNNCSDLNTKIESYWSATTVFLSGQSNQFEGSDNEAITELGSLLKNAVSKQSIADVPLGAFLSGGIDSSLIVALMQSQSEKPVKTFTIGFNENEHNEANYAKAVAKHLGTNHSELYVTPQEALNVIPKLPTLYDEPFADSSQIPTFLVSQMTSQHVTVSLSGDAGDELFGGYNRYIITKKLWSKLSCLPKFVRHTLGNNIIRNNSRYETFYRSCQFVIPKFFQVNNFGEKIDKGSKLLTQNSIESLYHELISHMHPSEILLNTGEISSIFNDLYDELSTLDDIHRMMAYDTLTYLPDDILVKVDRAAMGVSLETRVPMLDHRIAEFAWSLPTRFKFRTGKGKWILRELLREYVPDSLIDRPKMGFGVPISQWLRGPLRDWAQNLLDDNRIKQEGFFDYKKINSMLSDHLSGNRNLHYQLWNILMFQAWLEENN